MVKTLSPEEKSVLKAYSEVFGKGSYKWQLIEFYYSQDKFDGEAEKEHFKGNDLKSLKRDTKKWFIQALKRLNFFNGPILNIILEIRVSVERQGKKHAIELLNEAKEIATKRENYSALLMLNEEERRLIINFEVGEERVNALNQLNEEAIFIQSQIALLNKYERFRINYFEKIKAEVQRNGTTSANARNLISSIPTEALEASPTFPKRIQLEIYLQKELISYVQGELNSALSLGKSILEIFNESPWFKSGFSSEYSKVLWRIHNYSANLGLKDEAEKIISEFEKLEPDSPLNRADFLDKYLICLLTYSIEFDSKYFTEKALVIAENQASFLDFNLPITQKPPLFTYLLQGAIWLGDVKSARKWNRLLQQIISRKQSRALFFHAQLLQLFLYYLEEDYESIQSHARNYLRGLPDGEVDLEPFQFIYSQLRKSKKHKKEPNRSNYFMQMTKRINGFSEDELVIFWKKEVLLLIESFRI